MSNDIAELCSEIRNTRCSSCGDNYQQEESCYCPQCETRKYHGWLTRISEAEVIENIKLKSGFQIRKKENKCW